MICNTCKARYCGKCLNKEHKGLCDIYEVELLLKNLNYKRCKKCKMIIEKTQGCNHITCRCGFQFCYVCGDDWSPQHYNHNTAGRPVQNRVQQGRNYRIQPIQPFNQPAEQQRRRIRWNNYNCLVVALLFIFVKIPLCLLLLILLILIVMICLPIFGILSCINGLFCLGFDCICCRNPMYLIDCVCELMDILIGENCC